MEIDSVQYDNFCLYVGRQNNISNIVVTSILAGIVIPALQKLGQEGC